VGYAVTAPDGFDARLVPLALVAVTVHLYVDPTVRPVTVSGVAVPDFIPATPPLLDTHDAV